MQLVMTSLENRQNGASWCYQVPAYNGFTNTNNIHVDIVATLGCDVPVLTTVQRWGS